MRLRFFLTVSVVAVVVCLVVCLLNTRSLAINTLSTADVSLFNPDVFVVGHSGDKSPWTQTWALQQLADTAANSESKPLSSTWTEDPTVSQGTYIQKDNSARLIYPWAYESDAFDLRRDRPTDWFDDDDPREAIRPRIIPLRRH